MDETAQQVLAALGGADSITALEACITRVRTELADPSLVDADALKDAGAFSVLTVDEVVQVVVGPSAQELVAELERLRS